MRTCKSVRGVSVAVEETSSSSTLTGLSFFACFGIVAMLASYVFTTLNRAIYMYLHAFTFWQSTNMNTRCLCSIHVRTHGSATSWLVYQIVIILLHTSQEPLEPLPKPLPIRAKPARGIFNFWASNYHSVRGVRIGQRLLNVLLSLTSRRRKRRWGWGFWTSPHSPDPTHR